MSTSKSGEIWIGLVSCRNVNIVIVIKYYSFLKPYHYIKYKRNISIVFFITGLRGIKYDNSTIISIKIHTSPAGVVVSEHQPMNQQVTIQFIVRVYAPVAGLTPSRRHAQYRGSMIPSHHWYFYLSLPLWNQ